MYTAKEVGDISLSGKDALVIIANSKELEGSGANEFFEGVFRHGRLAPDKHRRATEIIQSLNGGTLPTVTDAAGFTGLSERTIADLLFHSHNEIAKFYRNDKKNKEHISELKKWVEMYFQANILMFTAAKAFTPYKVKLSLMIALLEAGPILSLYEHLTEGLWNLNPIPNF